MSRVLDRVQHPRDLRALTPAELTALAAEIRAVIIATVAANGGHLASNLGVVELTLALHRVFDSPHDALVWDTSNQTYAHKLVTGRA
ncbi:MAG: 1-deoxy-D-xylulose-5-phosphate synthase, partial [Actinobacteria bacterium]|nr:1-deoxy-D-xylulose-5-phosphate synthase [Actinomycetota bacterium]